MDTYNHEEPRPTVEMYIPLDFWFNNDPSLAIPLVYMASSYNDNLEISD